MVRRHSSISCGDARAAEPGRDARRDPARGQSTGGVSREALSPREIRRPGVPRPWHLSPLCGLVRWQCGASQTGSNHRAGIGAGRARRRCGQIGRAGSCSRRAGAGTAGRRTRRTRWRRRAGRRSDSGDPGRRAADADRDGKLLDGKGLPGSLRARGRPAVEGLRARPGRSMAQPGVLSPSVRARGTPAASGRRNS